MAAYTVVSSKSATLTGATVDTVTLSGTKPGQHLLLTNVSGASQISASIDGSTPTVGGDDLIHVPAGMSIDVALLSTAPSVVVKVIGNGNTYVVQVVS